MLKSSTIRLRAWVRWSEEECRVTSQTSSIFNFKCSHCERFISLLMVEIMKLWVLSLLNLLHSSNNVLSFNINASIFQLQYICHFCVFSKHPNSIRFRFSDVEFQACGPFEQNTYDLSECIFSIRYNVNIENEKENDD